MAVAADGKSVISSVGVRKRSVWIHDASGERPVSLEGSATSPKVSSDGRRVYYLYGRVHLLPANCGRPSGLLENRTSRCRVST